MDIENQPYESGKKIKNGVLTGVNIVMFLIVMAFRNSQGVNTLRKTVGPMVGYAGQKAEGIS